VSDTGPVSPGVQRTFGIRVADWPPAKAGEAQLLDNVRLEPLTRVHPAAPSVLFLPVVALLWRSGFRDASHGGTWAAMPTLCVAMLAGLVLWTLTEYAIHRGIFHLRPRGHVGSAVAYLVHGVHHAYPTDRGRLVMPPVVTVPLAIAFYALFVGAAGQALGEGLYAGFLVGYVGYDTIHYVVHTRPARARWLAALQQNHMRHHFERHDRCFGVSTTLWDHVFRTR
jgi:sterol desaturase/sphingolipid hydroxylase (fatty acid hydroxylase superfamily)